jgi:Fe-S-cluster containining protein
MKQLLTLDHDEFQRKLTEDNPPCFMCGECCRCYSVEISPSDIDRLVELLGGSPREFVENHTKPGRFSWNPGCRILHKEDKVLRHSAMNPRLIPVQMAGERNRFERACIFLDEKEDGFFYCRVYTHRPAPCRGYETTNSLCRKTNQREHWGRQARRLVWVRLEPGQVSAMPFDEVAKGSPPQVFQRPNFPELDEAALAIELEVDDILEKARRELANT